MRVTDVRVNKIENPKGKTVAYVDATFDDAVEVKGFTIVNGANGYFLGMPQRKIGEEWKNSAFITDRDLRASLERMALSEMGLVTDSKSVGARQSKVPKEYARQAGVDTGWE